MICMFNQIDRMASLSICTRFVRLHFIECSSNDKPVQKEFSNDDDYNNDALMLRVSVLIIYMKKLLSSDWLRYRQFSGNSMQKKVNSVQRINKPDILIGH